MTDVSAGTAPSRAGSAVAAGSPARRLAAAVAAGAPILLLGASQGGYFPTAWGWAGIASGWAVLVWLAVGGPVRLTRLEVVTLAALSAYVGWIALSALWSETPRWTPREVERALIYPLGVLAVLLVATHRAVSHVLGGTVTAIALLSTYSAATRLFPERLGVVDPTAVDRLAAPIGYWNGLGIFAALGILLALAFAARAARAWTRAVAAGTLPVLLVVLYFTFSRASWVALGVGLAAALALDPRRLQLAAAGLALAPPGAISLVLASRFDALTHQAAPLAEATREGHRLAAAVALAALASAGLAVAVALAERRLRPGHAARRAFAAALGAAVLAAVALALVRFGGPATIATDAYDAFHEPPAPVTKPGDDLNRRLTSLSGNGRVDMWTVALEAYADSPILGTGAGSYERLWLRHRTIETNVRDAHSIYLEALAELGPVGIGLLLLAFVPVGAAARRARRHPLVPAALGAFAAYAAHAAVDWDWELPAVTFAGLFAGAAVLVAARQRDDLPAAGARTRVALGAATILLTAVALFGLLGNTALSASADATAEERYAEAARQARRAQRWMPWSSEPWHRLASAQIQAGDAGAARASLREALERDRDDWELWLDLALASRGEARTRAARVALALNPRSAEIRHLRPALGLPPDPG